MSSQDPLPLKDWDRMFSMESTFGKIVRDIGCLSEEEMVLCIYRATTDKHRGMCACAATRGWVKILEYLYFDARVPFYLRTCVLMEDLPVHPDAAVFMEKYRALWEAGEFPVIGIKAAKK